MDPRAGPQASWVIEDALSVERIGYLSFVFLAFRKALENPLDDLHFYGWPRREDDTICLQTLPLAILQNLFEISILIDEMPSKAEASGTTLPETKLNQATLSGEYFD
jgi:hypothetical protein